ncbi:methyltransferase domain-containing protein [Candidatus Woesebacteria bacterium]|nr:methyltransferase domain-containing protein [Candidatus Woesebacteria bacterium]
MNDTKQVKDSWDAVYQTGDKYKDEPPIPFTKTIISTLEKQNLLAGKGLYIGCGNGRNFIPLIDQGLDLVGLDISDTALKQISNLKPELKDKLMVLSFSDYQPAELFDYVIAIQVFQHGNYDETKKNFQKVVDILKPGGLFFLRNRSTKTTLDEEYEMIEETPEGGFTVRYLSGSKSGLEIHFLSERELDELVKIGLNPVIPAYKVKTPRKLPKHGVTVHWEGVWQKGNFLTS